MGLFGSRNARDPLGFDWAAFEVWYKGSRAELISCALRTTRGDKALAEDLCQEAIKKVFIDRGLERLIVDNEAMPYLKTTIHNLFIDHVRKKHPEFLDESVLDIFDVNSFDNTDLLMERIHAKQSLGQLLSDLDDKDRKILGMMFDGAKLSEIAKKHGLSYVNAGTKVYRIRHKIKELLGDL
jgi:RNA polymerase sigma factor (sigma-70 family)